MVRDARSVRRVHVGVLAQRLERSPRLFEAAHARDHVDKRLGGKTGNGCRADVVDATLQPKGEHAFQERTLGLKATRPLWVVRDDGDGVNSSAVGPMSSTT